MIQSVLATASPNQVVWEPFPHLVINEVLDPGLFGALAETMPSPASLNGGRPLRNRKAGLNARNILDSPDISPVWKDFVAFHSSGEFFRDVVRVFGPAIERLYPRLARERGKALERFQTVRRTLGDRAAEHANDDIALECQIMADDTREARVCRGPHVDNPAELYAGLLYFRDDDDTSEGGALCICRASRPERVFSRDGAVRVAARPAELDDDDVEVVTEIPYAANTAVFFLNGPAAIHKVTERQATLFPRRHVNIIGEVYSLPSGRFFRLERPGAGTSRARNVIGRAFGRMRARAG